MTITTTITTTKRHGLLMAAAALACAFHPAHAQTNGALYDPQPPADSAYVRVIVVSADGPVDVQLDGKPRLHGLAGAAPSDYMVVKAGAHKLSLQLAGKPTAVDVNLEVVAGRSMTIALPALRADSKPQFFEDKANANKLKAVLTFYHLAPKAGPVDMLTADGSTKVFSAVAPGALASLSVNPIAVELQATRPGDKAGLAKASLTMAQGQTYSLLLLPGDGDKLVLKAGINTLERYTGK